MRTPLELLDDGWKALVDGLGLAGAMRYKALFQLGKGERMSGSANSCSAT